MAYNTTAALDKLACTDFVDFVSCQDRIGQIFLVRKFFRVLGRGTQSVREG